jgi:hypothetical protein
MPKDFSQHGKFPKWNKNLYGLKQSPRNHFENLPSKLTAFGLKPCDADPCLFVSDKCVCFVYVDDTLLSAQNSADIDAVVYGLRILEMDLGDEDDVAGSLAFL